MRPGEVICDRDVAAAVASALDAWEEGVDVVFECVAGADCAQERLIDARFKTLVAKLRAELGPPDASPTRSQGLVDPPRHLDPKWVRAAMRRRSPLRITATLSGGPGKAHAIELRRDREQGERA